MGILTFACEKKNLGESNRAQLETILGQTAEVFAHEQSAHVQNGWQ
jgi:hypothetical protein